MSCPSSSFCAAVGHNGGEVTYNGSSWTGPVSIDPNGQGLSSVSCPSSSFCVAVDGASDALAFNGSSWSTAVNIEPGGRGLASVSCPSSSFCIAVDDAGGALEYPAASGPPPTTAKPPLLSHLRLTPAFQATPCRRARGHAPCATTIRYDDSAAATTTLTIRERKAGVLVRGRCVAPPRRAHGRQVRACGRTVLVGSFAHFDAAGVNTIRFTGHLGRHRLALGGYTLSAVARLGGKAGATIVARFTIKR